LTADEASRLFHDFVRIRNSQTREITGSGLGLTIVRKIAQLYGGRASVESQPGVGSTFTVVLKRRMELQAGTDGLPRTTALAAGN
jgi:signal transduction histidine kinase